jgi:hypothetical protein
MLSAFAGFALFASAGPLSAQDAVAAGGDVEVRRISNILKTKVVIQDNKPAGEIVDVVYNDGGCIDYYVASYNNQMYVVPFDVVQYRAQDRVVFVDIAPTAFQQVQFFSSNQWPNLYAPAFRNQVFSTFNVRGGAAGAAGVRTRTTLRQGTDVNVNSQNRTDVNRTDVNSRTDANAKDAADRAPMTDRNRDSATDRTTRDSDPKATDRNRPERNPATTPDSSDRPKTGADDNTPPPPRPGSGNNPGREGATPPRAGSDTNPGRGSNPPSAGSDSNPGKSPTPPPAGVKPGSESNSPAKPQPKADDKKPLPPPPVVPK